MSLLYQSGFGNHFATEALAGALPEGQNSPQRCAYGLYAEQFTGSAFTAPRHQNFRSWLYRIRPSVKQSAYRPLADMKVATAPLAQPAADPNQMRWDPVALPESSTDFIDGLLTIAVNGDAGTQAGCGVHVYAFNKDMTNRFFYNADGELLIVPQLGTLHLRTEMGELTVANGEIALIPRGIKFQVRLGSGDDAARGYICENYGSPFELPGLGPIGANGLANPRDFLSPVAAYEDLEGEFELVAKFSGRFWVSDLDHSPLDVVAWHGNVTPYKYNLVHFNTINTVSFDHPDPSIFTVLTSASDTPGTANIDFVIFPPRWMVADNTFRPPYFHRNLMSEFMGLIHGEYDAKAEGFLPGGASLHNSMSPHGPDADTFEKASAAELKPQHQKDTLAFMFESRFIYHPTKTALEADFRQKNYVDVWSTMRSHFDPTQP
ncbi:homogentisate 1,2-dioxygenase [Halomonas campaniensis]|uniref:Homogentisate 1,2-dioxygenase n=1 Tax=Halomonas campaniensis TaxID=213554 RepID=A0A246S3X8_9GAMM|nr:homogentisate 1,2-dioxygenase [Halomonas campaniensis]OWV31172.1 homogentisate 1,2-dioxygenase [Halomonas campaniensis]